ncbi:MAG: hypothetical protein ACFFCT_12030 [Candidatus Odinarchaeota archaeon]
MEKEKPYWKIKKEQAKLPSNPVRLVDEKLVWRPLIPPPSKNSLRKLGKLGKWGVSPFQTDCEHVFEIGQAFAIIPGSGHPWLKDRRKEGYLGYIWVESKPPLTQFTRWALYTPPSLRPLDGYVFVQDIEEGEYTFIRLIHLWGATLIDVNLAKTEIRFDYEKDVDKDGWNAGRI